MRLGVQLTPKLARLFDLVKTFPGIGTAELKARLELAPCTALAPYVWLLNNRLAGTDWEVRGNRGWGYSLVRRVNKSVDNGRGFVYRPKHAKSAPVQVKKERAGVRP